MKVVIHSYPPDKLYEYPTYDPMDASNRHLPLPTDYIESELKEVGRRYRSICVLIGWIHLSYYVMNVIRDNQVQDRINVLSEIEFTWPKWVNKLK